MSQREWKSMRAFEEIKLEFWNHIAKITINRPRYYNAFTPTTTTEMAVALEILREDQEVYTIIQTEFRDSTSLMFRNKSARSQNRL